jgi:hypothetical protein
MVRCIHVDNDDWREFAFARALWFLACLELSKPIDFEEMIEYSGGSVHHLPDPVVSSLEYALQTRESPLADRTFFSLHIIIEIVFAAALNGSFAVK